MINATVRLPKKTGRWTSYEFGHRKTEHESRDAAITSLRSSLEEHARRFGEGATITVHEADGSTSKIEIAP